MPSSRPLPAARRWDSPSPVVSGHPELLPADRLLRVGVLAGGAGLGYLLPLAP